MEQADFDKEFARFQAGARVLAEAAAEDPALAARLAAAMDAAVPDAAAAEQQAQEAARANALRADRGPDGPRRRRRVVLYLHGGGFMTPQRSGAANPRRSNTTGRARARTGD